MFVRVAVQPDLVACVPDFGELLWERFDAVGRGEESGFDVVFAVQFEEAINPDVGAEYPTRHVGWVLRRAVGRVDPIRYRVDIDWKKVCDQYTLLLGDGEDVPP